MVYQASALYFTIDISFMVVELHNSNFSRYHFSSFLKVFDYILKVQMYKKMKNNHYWNFSRTKHDHTTKERNLIHPALNQIEDLGLLKTCPLHLQWISKSIVQQLSKQYKKFPATTKHHGMLMAGQLLSLCIIEKTDWKYNWLPLWKKSLAVLRREPISQTVHIFSQKSNR